MIPFRAALQLGCAHRVTDDSVRLRNKVGNIVCACVRRKGVACRRSSGNTLTHRCFSLEVYFVSLYDRARYKSLSYF